MSENTDLKIVALFVVITILVVAIFPLNSTTIRTLLGIPMVLFLPGYALIAALFPRISDLDGIERLALSFGMSIAVVPLIGLGLNFTRFGIRLNPILFSLSAFIIVMCILAHFRRSKLSQNERFTIPFSDIYFSLKEEILSSKSRIDKILTIMLILSIFISITMLTYVIFTPKQGEKFTEFYILGNNGKAEGYPTLLEVGNNSSIIVGIVNHEYNPTNYTLKILLKNETLSSMQVQLDHNSTLEKRVFFTPGKTGDKIRLEFFLYKDENFTSPYRDLHLWVNVSST